MSIQPVIAQGSAQTVPTNTSNSNATAGTAAATDRKATRVAKNKEAKHDETRSEQIQEKVTAPFETTAGTQVGNSTAEPEKEVRADQEKKRLDLTA